MIPKDSKSYPYLAIAQHYGISYAEVLEYSENQDWINARYPPFTEWRFAVWCLERGKLK